MRESSLRIPRSLALRSSQTQENPLWISPSPAVHSLPWRRKRVNSRSRSTSCPRLCLKSSSVVCTMCVPQRQSACWPVQRDSLPTLVPHRLVAGCLRDPDKCLHLCLSEDFDCCGATVTASQFLYALCESMLFLLPYRTIKKLIDNETKSLQCATGVGDAVRKDLCGGSNGRIVATRCIYWVWVRGSVY